jgi:hypothetical protein
LTGYERLISESLQNLSLSSPPTKQYDIAIHVRLGDFAPAQVGVKGQNTRLPFEWYKTALSRAIEILGGGGLRGVLFTDGDLSSIISHLGLRNFEPEPSGTALSSLFCMAQARVIIASRSTFSLWGQYLGQSHAIWPQSFELARYKPLDAERDHFI